MALSATASIQLVKVLLNYVARRGRDFEGFCLTIGLHPDDPVFLDPDARIGGNRFFQIFELAQAHCPDPGFGLHLGGEIASMQAGGSVLIAMMMNCPTLGQALDRFFRYHDLMADTIRPCMVLEGDRGLMSWNPYSEKQDTSRQVSQVLLSSFVHLLRQLTDNAVEIAQVHFAFTQPEDVFDHMQVFRAPLVFDQPRSQVVFHKDVLDLPIRLASLPLLEVLEQFARDRLHKLYFADTWMDKVARKLGDALVRGEKPAMDLLARDLGQSVRNLQTKLKEEGTSFQKILESVRKEMALGYLKFGDKTLCDIAFLLGFSEQSAFNHAFKRWTGTTPGKFLSSKAIED